MNTGIGDAINLAWKLAWVLQDRANVSILESYESERVAFARRLVETTDQGFTAVTSSKLSQDFCVPTLFRLYCLGYFPSSRCFDYCIAPSRRQTSTIAAAR